MSALHEVPGSGPTAAFAARLCAMLPEIGTERLRLRAPRLEDFPAWAEIMCGPRAVHVDGPYGRDDAFMEFAASVGSWLLRGHGLWTVEPRDGGEVLGFVLLGFEPGDREPELGFLFREAAEGRGFAREAARAARDWGWAQSLPSMVSYVAPGNARSVALAERLGARHDEGLVDGSLVYRHSRPESAA